MKKDTFDDIKRANNKGLIKDHLEISSTGYGYESVSTPMNKQVKNNKN